MKETQKYINKYVVNNKIEKIKDINIVVKVQFGIAATNEESRNIKFTEANIIPINTRHILK